MNMRGALPFRVLRWAGCTGDIGVGREGEQVLHDRPQGWRGEETCVFSELAPDEGDWGMGCVPCSLVVTVLNRLFRGLLSPPQWTRRL